MIETNRIVYNQELTEGLEKEVIAFFNCYVDRMIYFGNDKTDKTIEVKDRDVLKVKDLLKNNIGHYYLVNTFEGY